MPHNYSGAIPSTQLVVGSYSAHMGNWTEIPNPTNAVGGSFILSLQDGARARPVPNPTNAVGGSFILGLHRREPHAGSKSHQRSWWIVHTQPTQTGTARRLRIPPTQVGGSFIPSLKRSLLRPLPEIRPTQLVRFGEAPWLS